VFTGIIETVGEVTAIEAAGEITRIAVAAPRIAPEVSVGDSVAVNGACLTVTAAAGAEVRFDAVAETLQKTSLGDLAVGSAVNLERAMRADGRFDGHIVQGHVDGVGRVRKWERNGDDVRLHVECAPALARNLIEKGSVTIDGVSLTVVGLRDDGFDVALIPVTLEHTTLGARRPGDRVNLEADVLGKYVQRYLERVVAGRDARSG
jgi:riboflavin synthase